jgi:hypothetical protein
VECRRSIALTTKQGKTKLAALSPSSHAPCMFVVSEADAAAIRDAFDQSGELSAAVELRRRFPLISYDAVARQWARTIAGWKPLPVMPDRVTKPRTSRRR